MLTDKATSITLRRRVFLSTLAVVLVGLGLTGTLALAVTSRATRSVVYQQAEEINKQVVFNYDRYIASVIETANYVISAVATVDAVEESSRLEELVALNADIKRDVVSILLLGADGEVHAGPGVRPGSNQSVTAEPWFTRAREQPEIFHFVVGPSLADVVSSPESVISVAREVEYLASGTRRRGVLLVELNLDVITDLAERTGLGAEGHILITDADDNLVYSSGGEGLTAESVPVAAALFIGGTATRLSGRDVYIHTNTLSDTRWRLATVHNVDQLSAINHQLASAMGLIGMLSLLLNALATAIISRRLSRPIDQLKMIMGRIEAGHLDEPVIVDGQVEIVELAHSFDQMVRRVRELMGRLVAEQKSKRKTELNILQNQINPHFLYNTLDSIIWLAENNRNRDVVSTVVALAQFFRLSISRGSPFITVEQEIEHVVNYLTIQMTRYVDAFTYTVDVAPEVRERKVMKLILQPLVENAIYHGIGDEREHIEIRAFPRDEMTVLEVVNTGYGLSEEQISGIRRQMEGTSRSESVGMTNVYQRLKLYYGPPAEIEIESEPDVSTTIRLLIPPPPQTSEVSP